MGTFGEVVRVRVKMVRVLYFKMAAPSPPKSRGHSWKESNLKELLAIMKEETIAHNLDDAKTPKEDRAAYNDTRVKLQNKGKIVDAILLTCRCRQFSISKYSLDNVLILLGITYTIESIINKWKKLMQQWSKKWKFFDDLDEICGHWDILSPSSLFDSSLREEVDSESVGTDDLGKQYNDCSEFLQVLFISLFSTHFCSVSPLAPIKQTSTKTLEEPSRTLPLFLSTVYKISYIQDSNSEVDW